MSQAKLHTWFQTHEDGTGPYMLQHLVPGQNTTLVKYPGYWGGWAGRHVSKIIVNVVTADATRRELVEKGDADLTETLTPNDLVAMRSNPNLVVSDSYGMTNLALVMTEAGPLKSAPARRAMSYAFDYNGFINGVLKGFGRESQGPLPRTFLGHNFSLPLYRTDLTKAKSLLQQAGVKSGTKLTMWYQSEDETTRNAALIMQAQLAQIGIQLKLESHDATSLISEYYGNSPASQRPNMFVWYWYPDYNDPGDWLFPQYDSHEWGSAGANGGYYKNRTVDRLLEAASKMSQTGPRIRLYDQVQKIVTWTDPAAVFLADLPESTVYRKTLHGYYLNPVYTATYNYYAMWKS
jgi:peptide/nickel transport system substrate-binding protein